MSKIKDLKTEESNIINVAEIFQGLFPDTKTKYLELLLRLSKNAIKESEYYRDVMKGGYEVSKRIKLEEYSEFESIFLMFLINEFVRRDSLETFMKFIEYNEKNQIEFSDITAISNFDTIENEVSKVEIRTVSKEMKNQIIKLYDDDEWIILKPLTVMASRKYGSNTKWCTTSMNEYSYFHSYASDGILIYCINKKTGYKVALYKTLRNNGRGELSFWDQKDNRIDSMETELPMHISQVLAADIKICKVSNRSLLSEEEKKKEDKIYPYHGNKSGMVANEIVNERNAIRVRDAEEEAIEHFADEVIEGLENEVMEGPENEVMEREEVRPSMPIELVREHNENNEEHINFHNELIGMQGGQHDEREINEDMGEPEPNREYEALQENVGEVHYKNPYRLKRIPVKNTDDDEDMGINTVAS